MEAGSWMKGPAPAADTGTGGSAAAGDGATGTGAGAGWKGGCTSGADTGGGAAGARSTIRGCECSTTHKQTGQLVFAPLIQRARDVKVVTTRGIAATRKQDINKKNQQESAWSEATANCKRALRPSTPVAQRWAAGEVPALGRAGKPPHRHSHGPQTPGGAVVVAVAAAAAAATSNKTTRTCKAGTC